MEIVSGKLWEPQCFVPSLEDLQLDIHLAELCYVTKLETWCFFEIFHNLWIWILKFHPDGDIPPFHNFYSDASVHPDSRWRFFGSAILSFHGQSPTEAQSVADVQSTNCFTSADAAQLEPSSPEPGRWSRYVDLHWLIFQWLRVVLQNFPQIIYSNIYIYSIWF